MIPIFQYFAMLTQLLTSFSPQILPFNSQRGPNGSLLAPSGSSWEPSGPVFPLSVTLWGPLGTLSGLSWSLLGLFSSIEEPQGPSQGVFYSIFINVQLQLPAFSDMKSIDFHTPLSTISHKSFLSFPSLQSLFPSNPPILQASNPPMLGRRNARSDWINQLN